MEALHRCAAIRNEFEGCLSVSCAPRVPRDLRLHDGPLFARFALHGTERSISSTRETHTQTANVSFPPYPDPRVGADPRLQRSPVGFRLQIPVLRWVTEIVVIMSREEVHLNPGGEPRTLRADSCDPTEKPKTPFTACCHLIPQCMNLKPQETYSRSVSTGSYRTE